MLFSYYVFSPSVNCSIHFPLCRYNNVQSGCTRRSKKSFSLPFCGNSSSRAKAKAVAAEAILADIFLGSPGKNLSLDYTTPRHPAQNIIYLSSLAQILGWFHTVNILSISIAACISKWALNVAWNAMIFVKDFFLQNSNFSTVTRALSQSLRTKGKLTIAAIPLGNIITQNIRSKLLRSVACMQSKSRKKTFPFPVAEVRLHLLCCPHVIVISRIMYFLLQEYVMYFDKQIRAALLAHALHLTSYIVL